MNREEYVKFREKKSIITQRFQIKWKARVYELLGGKCIKCSFNDIRALQIDHVNGYGSIVDRNRNSMYYKKVAESIQRGEKEYQILCANCNWIKRYENGEKPNYYRKRTDKSFLNTLPIGEKQIEMDL